MAVVQDHRALGDLRLHENALWHRALDAAEEGSDVIASSGILFQGAIQQSGDAVAGDIVRSGAKTAGGDNKVGTVKALAHGGLYGWASVGHGDLPFHCPAMGIEFAPKPLLIAAQTERPRFL